ncbi:hypothetical protein D3C71_1850520 [compost metagenome]
MCRSRHHGAAIHTKVHAGATTAAGTMTTAMGAANTIATTGVDMAEGTNGVTAVARVTVTGTEQGSHAATP